ncbi:hypothetical protein KIPB_000357 [Kipferlia bialata]|uniref:Methyltransferase domain-containing protein n=1 Tax=Kipferlia bialata TaxID=797122 RepID=A0A9K3GEL8_9EUKA|nr:hypothetical protein KIPB_000357 [Kipferlia bialata]|eukprot:g357.t1
MDDEQFIRLEAWIQRYGELVRTLPWIPKLLGFSPLESLADVMPPALLAEVSESGADIGVFEGIARALLTHPGFPASHPSLPVSGMPWLEGYSQQLGALCGDAPLERFYESDATPSGDAPTTPPQPPAKRGAGETAVDSGTDTSRPGAAVSPADTLLEERGAPPSGQGGRARGPSGTAKTKPSVLGVGARNGVGHLARGLSRPDRVLVAVDRDPALVDKGRRISAGEDTGKASRKVGKKRAAGKGGTRPVESTRALPALPVYPHCRHAVFTLSPANLDLSPVLSQHIQGGEKERVGLVGLHTCGDFGPCVLKAFLATQGLSHLVHIPCCYHALTSAGVPLSTPLSAMGTVPRGEAELRAFTNLGCQRYDNFLETEGAWTRLVLSRLRQHALQPLLDTMQGHLDRMGLERRLASGCKCRLPPGRASFHGYLVHVYDRVCRRVSEAGGDTPLPPLSTLVTETLRRLGVTQPTIDTNGTDTPSTDDALSCVLYDHVYTSLIHGLPMPSFLALRQTLILMAARATELCLAMDRVLYLRQAGCTVRVGEFVPVEQTSRNIALVVTKG